MWFRLRYDDQGIDMTLALRHLDRLARDRLEAVWIATRGNLALLVKTSTEREAVLVEGLANVLPGARITRENVDLFMADLPARYHLTGPLPAGAPLPEMLLRMGSDAAISLSWNKGNLSMPVLATRENMPKATEIVQAAWPGARLFPFSPPLVRLAILPSQLFGLPPAEHYPTLASRNANELQFAHAHASGLIVGSDVSGQPVCVQRPARLVWVGAPARVDNVFAWIAQRWQGQVVVLDASAVDKGWQDISQADVNIAWSSPGKSTHLNPLMRLPGENTVAYTQRAIAWLNAVGLHATSLIQVLGARAAELVQAIFHLAAEFAELDPPTVLSLLSAPAAVLADVEKRAPEVLSEAEMSVWRTRDWGRDTATLAVLVSRLRMFFQSPESALCMPPYAPSTVVKASKWIIARVPRDEQAQRIYWAGLWPLLGAAFARPDALVLGLGLGLDGKLALGLSNGGASVLVWGRSLQEATGSQAVVDPQDDLLVGADTDPGVFVPILREALGKRAQGDLILRKVAPYALAAQAADQAIARIGGDVGSARLHLPDQERRSESGWSTASGIAVPPLAAVLGDEDAARAAVVSLIVRSAAEGRRVLVVGNRSLWELLRSRQPDALLIPIEELPMLNPLERISGSDPFRWIWWGSGLRLPSALMQEAYRDGVKTLQDLLAYALKSGAEESAALVRDALKSGIFGVEESDPRAWFERGETKVLAVEAYHPALTRYLAVIALDAQARLVAWQAPGLAATDKAALRKMHSLIYPDVMWSPDVLVSRVSNGTLAVLPDRLGQAAQTLPIGEVYLYRRGQDQHYFKLALVEK